MGTFVQHRQVKPQPTIMTAKNVRKILMTMTKKMMRRMKKKKTKKKNKTAFQAKQRRWEEMRGPALKAIT